MISFITLSRTPARVETLQTSITEMLGPAGWELVVVDGNSYDIFRGYNHGASEASFDKLVFVHDDVVFLCNSRWFQQWLTLLDRPETGFLGVAGSLEIPPDGMWWNGSTFSRGSVLHPGPAEFGILMNVWPGNIPGIGVGAGLYGRVAVLDGVLLMTHRRAFDIVAGFNESEYAGFHFYDVDITYRACLLGLENFAVPVPILHDSEGRTGKAYDENRVKFLRKHGHSLPYRLDVGP